MKPIKSALYLHKIVFLIHETGQNRELYTSAFTWKMWKLMLPIINFFVELQKHAYIVAEMKNSLLLKLYYPVKISVFVLIFLIFCLFYADAQQFTATEGSIYGGVINTGVQPASAVNMPYYWDIEVAGMNLFWNNNIFSFSPAKWKWNSDTLNTSGRFIPGDKKRWATVQADVHLLNFLFRWPHRNDLVVGAGWNIHSRIYPDNMDFFYEDSIKTTEDLLKDNAFNTLQQGTVINQQWMEWYVTASKVLLDNHQERLTAGATLKLLKGMAAEVIDIRGLSVGINKSANPNDLVFTYAAGRYGYSQNLENLNNRSSTGENIRTLMNGSPLSPGLDFGISYLIREQDAIPGFTKDEPAGYNWKIEASITDWGRLKYPLGSQSMNVAGVKGQPSVRRVLNIIDSIKTVQALNDSLSAVADLKPWNGAFSVSLPTALRINVDKYIGADFFLNTRLVLGMSFLNPGVDYKINPVSYVMVTPRWEIKRIGIYAPLYMNFHGSLMAGAALRLGPLLVGLHDFGWLFHDRPGGGGYVALVIRGLFKNKDECPSF